MTARMLALTALFAALLAAPASAADFRVDTTADGDDKECVQDCTLREAVVLAGSGDQILVPAGNYVLADGELSLNNDTIVGEDARKTFIDGAGKSRVLRVIEVTSRVSNVTIRNGNGVGLDPDGVGGGIFIHSGTLLLQNSTVSGNTGVQGAGIAASGIAQLIGVTVSGNTASAGRLTRGGGIATSSTGGVLLGNSTVSGNTAVDQVGAASQGGGIYSAGALAIIASTIAGNSATEGGGLYVVSPPTGGAGTLQNSLLAHGTGGACGGPGGLNATANVVSDGTCQLKDPSNLQDVNPRIGALADNGGPTNTHALQPASPAIGRAASCAATDQRGFTRVAPCDSGAYEYRAPTLRVVMQVVNDSGGTRTPDQFSVHVRRGGVDVEGSPQPGDEKGTTYMLDAGSTYAAAADAVAGYTLSSSGDCSVTLQEGQNRTCTITANDIAPTLRVITNVANNDGGTLGPANFTARVRSGGIDVVGSPQPGTSTGTLYSLSAGVTYTVSADAVAGYTFTLSGDCAANGTISMTLGQSRTCTISANDVAPTLRVVTTVTNDAGGTLAASGVTAHVREGADDVPTSPQPGSSTGTTYTLTGGRTYTVGADPVGGYELAVGGACAANGNVTLQVGQNLSCTIAATDIAPTLTVVTNVENDAGGTLAPADVTGHVRAGASDVATSPRPGTAAGTTYTLSAGPTYTVAADPVTGYQLAITGACAANGTVTLPLGQNRTCTITARDVAPTLRVITTVVNDDGGDLEADDVGVHVRRGANDVPGSPKPGADAPGAEYSVIAGAHTVSADAEAGYSATYGGACAANGEITLALAQTATCTVTLDDGAATLTVSTQVVNDHGGSAGPGSFAVHVRRGGADVAGSPQPGSGSGTAYTLQAGTHVVSADAISGYGSTVSGDCAGDGSITLGVGESKSCTVTANDDPPPPAAQPSFTAQQLPPPEPGKSVNALPKSGTVKVKLPGSAAYVDLEEAQQLPVGTVVDARKGHVTLIAAADDSGGTATAEFWAGIFRLGQSKGAAPTTVLTLVEKLTCPRKGRASVAAKGKKKRRLWGDGSGRFRTKGKHSAATVVGTRWLVEDTCTTTLTRVVRGRVSVRDFVKKKTVVVRAGKKYVARAKKK